MIVPIINHFHKLDMLLLDELHPHQQGNKYYKLKYNLQKAKELNCTNILTLGGAFSNHIYATALTGKLNGFKTIGVIRGEESSQLNPTLKAATDNGLQLIYLDRAQYRDLRNSELTVENIENILALKLPSDTYVLPEGGTNELALKGTREILNSVNISNYDVFCVSIGTGGTIAGIIDSLKTHPEKQVLGFSSLKGEWIKDEVQQLITSTTNNWTINTSYHFGGYAKWNTELIEFINQFKQVQKVALCSIYTGKMMYGLFDLIKLSHIAKDARILAIHTGGLQSIEGFNQVNGKLLL